MPRLLLPGVAIVVLVLVVIVLWPADPATMPVTTPKPGPVSVMAVSDFVCPPGSPTIPNTCRHSQVTDVIKKTDHDFVLALGDLQYQDATYDEFMAPGGSMTPSVR